MTRSTEHGEPECNSCAIKSGEEAGLADAEGMHRGPLVPPVVWGAAAFGAQIALSRRATVSPAGVLSAAALATASTWLLAGSVRQFLRQRTTIDPMRLRPTLVVDSGPYRASRNPMYLGGAGFLISHAALRGSVKALIPTGLFLLVIDRFQVAAEETALRGNLGAEYESYAERTPRWIGWTSLACSKKDS